MSVKIPNGFDWADGITLLPNPFGADATIGTPTPYSKVSVDGSTVTDSSDVDSLVGVQEDSTSPEIERAEQATVQHVCRTSWGNGLALIGLYGRGLEVIDSNGYTYRVLSSKIKRTHGGMCELTITSEAKSFDNPPDEFTCTPVELGIDIMKHPRYVFALKAVENTANGQKIIQNLLLYRENVTLATRNQARSAIHTILDTAIAAFDDPTSLAAAAALEIIKKIWLNEDSPYIVGYKIVWSQYFWKPPLISPGGYIENPVADTNVLNPGLPGYFYLTDSSDPLSTETIFDDIVYVNPQCYSSDGTIDGDLEISWMRQADDLEYQRTWFRLTRTWIGAPFGHWDTDIYSMGDRPSIYSAYNYAIT